MRVDLRPRLRIRWHRTLHFAGRSFKLCRRIQCWPIPYNLQHSLFQCRQVAFNPRGEYAHQRCHSSNSRIEQHQHNTPCFKAGHRHIVNHSSVSCRTEHIFFFGIASAIRQNILDQCRCAGNRGASRALRRWADCPGAYRDCFLTKRCSNAQSAALHT